MTLLTHNDGGVAIRISGIVANPFLATKDVAESRSITAIRKLVNILVAELFKEFNHLALVAQWIIGAYEGLITFIGVTDPTSVTAALAYALRKFALLQLLSTEGALLNNAGLFVEVTNAVRASGNTRLAANAHLWVDLNGAIFCYIRSRGWANAYALRISAVLAGDRQEVHIYIRIVTRATSNRIRPNTYHLVPIIADRNFVYGFTCHAAGKATYAAIDVSNNRFRHGLLPSVVDGQPLFEAWVVRSVNDWRSVACARNRILKWRILRGCFVDLSEVTTEVRGT